MVTHCKKVNNGADSDESPLFHIQKALPEIGPTKIRLLRQKIRHSEKRTTGIYVIPLHKQKNLLMHILLRISVVSAPALYRCVSAWVFCCWADAT